MSLLLNQELSCPTAGKCPGKILLFCVLYKCRTPDQCTDDHQGMTYFQSCLLVSTSEQMLTFSHEILIDVVVNVKWVSLRVLKFGPNSQAGFEINARKLTKCECF